MWLLENIHRLKKKAAQISGIKKKIQLILFLLFPIGKKAYLIGTPEYSNLGDSAIAISQLLFLKKCGFKNSYVKEITKREFLASKKIMRRYIKSKNLICGIGGGNLGNQWYREELFRYQLIDTFPNNHIIIFPQSIFFTDDKNGSQAIALSKKYYESARNLTIVAREKQSFNIIKNLYHNPTKIMSPDMVLSTTMYDYGVKKSRRSGGLLVFRNDEERKMTEKDRQKIKQFLNENNITYRITDMHADEPVTKFNRMNLVRKKMQEFADSEFVITDRLHGMVFATLTETPCIVFSNYNHKVKGTFEWVSYLPYIIYADNAENVINSLQSLLAMNNVFFDNDLLLNCFQQLKELVEEER